jgi:hypothetical protein
MNTVEQILYYAKRGWLELPPLSQYRGTVKIPNHSSEKLSGIQITFESFEDPKTGEVLYR